MVLLLVVFFCLQVYREMEEHDISFFAAIGRQYSCTIYTRYAELTEPARVRLRSPVRC